MKINYGLETILSQVRRDERHKSTREKYDFELAYNKITVSGDKGQIVKIKKFQFPIFYGYKSIGGRNSEYDDEFEVDDMRKETDRKRTILYARERIHDLANDNFKRGDRFATFVHAEPILDLKLSNRYFNKFIKRLKYQENNGENFKYLSGIEFKQKNRECIHYHVLWDLKYIKQKRLLEIWGKGKGSVFIRRIYHVNNLGDYLVKYIGKSVYDKRFEGQKVYLCSKGLKRRKGLYASDDEVEEFVKEKKIRDSQVTFSRSYESEFYGWVSEKEYNLEKRG